MPSATHSLPVTAPRVEALEPSQQLLPQRGERAWRDGWGSMKCMPPRQEGLTPRSSRASPPDNSMHRTALRAAVDADFQASKKAAMTAPAHPPSLPVTNDTVHEFYDWLFAPSVKELGLRDFAVLPGQVVATLPQSKKLQFVSGAVCGQVIMSAVDTVASLAMAVGVGPTTSLGHHRLHGQARPLPRPPQLERQVHTAP
jgi:hypothetical protein